jgi:hypothetical protein
MGYGIFELFFGAEKGEKEINAENLSAQPLCSLFSASKK